MNLNRRQMAAIAPKCKEMTRRVSGVPPQDKTGAPASLGQSGPPEILFLKRSKVGPLRAPQRFSAHYILCGYIDGNGNKKLGSYDMVFRPQTGPIIIPFCVRIFLVTTGS